MRSPNLLRIKIVERLNLLLISSESFLLLSRGLRLLLHHANRHGHLVAQLVTSLGPECSDALSRVDTDLVLDRPSVAIVFLYIIASIF